MSAAGVFLIAVPVGFNVAFARLAARFDYPDVLRRPTSEVLARFRAGGTGLVLTWWAFALTAVLMVPLVELLSQAIADADPALLSVATTVGVLAAAVQFLGLVRWPFLLTGAWTTLIGIALTQSDAAAGWVGIPGIVIGPALMLCALEFVGSHEPGGWKLAEKLTPVAYVAWSLWLIAAGVALL